MINSKKKNNWILDTILMLLAVVYLLPFYISTINAFKTEADIFANPMGIPFTRLTLDNLIRNFNSPTFSVIKAYTFTFIVVVITLLFVVIMASAMAYVLSRKRKGFYRGAYFLLLAGMMIPIQVIFIPIVQILKTLNMILSIQGLILVYVAWYMPFTTFILTGYIGTISPQLDESATMDGAGPLRIFWSIILPLLRPALASAVIFITLWTWNDFITPLIIFGSSEYYTITTGIYRAIGQYTQKWDNVFAILLYASVPVATLFIMLQNQFISGLTAGSVKG